LLMMRIGCITRTCSMLIIMCRIMRICWRRHENFIWINRHTTNIYILDQSIQMDDFCLVKSKNGFTHGYDGNEKYLIIK
jgi:hypothetical protein